MTTRLHLVVAHPDDETFGCGSLLLHAAAAGVETVVTCATRGEAGEPPAGSALGPAELGRVREQELRSAASVLGVRTVEVHVARVLLKLDVPVRSAVTAKLATTAK